jgi:hypothetical protein
LGILAMGTTTTPIQLPKMQLIYGIHWLRFTTGVLMKERETFETTKEDSNQLCSQFVQKTKNKKNLQNFTYLFCVGQ